MQNKKNIRIHVVFFSCGLNSYNTSLFFMSWWLDSSRSVVAILSNLFPESLTFVGFLLCTDISSIWALEHWIFCIFCKSKWESREQTRTLSESGLSTWCWEKLKCSGVFTCEPAWRFLGCMLIYPCLLNLICASTILHLKIFIRA